MPSKRNFSATAPPLASDDALVTASGSCGGWPPGSCPAPGSPGSSGSRETATWSTSARALATTRSDTGCSAAAATVTTSSPLLSA